MAQLGDIEPGCEVVFVVAAIRYGAYDWRIVNNKQRAESLGGTLDLPARAVGMATASKILYQTSQGLDHMNIHHISSGTVLAGPSPVEIVRKRVMAMGVLDVWPDRDLADAAELD